MLLAGLLDQELEVMQEQLVTKGKAERRGVVLPEIRRKKIILYFLKSRYAWNQPFRIQPNTGFKPTSKYLVKADLILLFRVYST